MDSPTNPPPRASRASIIGAATRLLDEQGAAAFTTRAVAAAAGVQAPAIYRLFGDKQGLLEAVAHDAMARYVAGKGHAPSADPVTALREAWRSHVDFGLAHPVLYELMTRWGSGTGDDGDGGDGQPGKQWARGDLVAAGADVLRGHIGRLASSGLLRVDEQRAVDVVHATGHGVLLALLERPAAQRDVALSETVLDAALQAILVAPAETVTSPGTPLQVAVALVGVLADLPGLTGAERALLGEWMRRVIDALADR